MKIETANSESIKHIDQSIDEYFANTEIGSAELLALSDLITEEKSLRRLRAYKGELVDFRKNHPQPEEHHLEVGIESDLRRAEMTQVLTEERIQQRSATVPGYAVARITIKRLKDEYAKSEIKNPGYAYKPLNAPPFLQT